VRRALPALSVTLLLVLAGCGAPLDGGGTAGDAESSRVDDTLVDAANVESGEDGAVTVTVSASVSSDVSGPTARERSSRVVARG